VDTERFVYQDLDWILSRIVFSMITVLGHRIGLLCRGSCSYFLADAEQFVYRDSDWIQLRIICTTITVLGHRIRLFCHRLCAYFSGYRTICVSGLGLDLVVDHFYYDYCTGTPDWIIVSRIVCIL
jgi:hypothetical protein